MNACVSKFPRAGEDDHPVPADDGHVCGERKRVRRAGQRRRATVDIRARGDVVAAGRIASRRHALCAHIERAPSVVERLHGQEIVRERSIEPAEHQNAGADGHDARQQRYEPASDPPPRSIGASRSDRSWGLPRGGDTLRIHVHAITLVRNSFAGRSPSRRGERPQGWGTPRRICSVPLAPLRVSPFGEEARRAHPRDPHRDRRDDRHREPRRHAPGAAGADTRFRQPPP